MAPHIEHDQQWQVVEEREPFTVGVRAQNVWSPAYVDALIERDRNADGSSGTGNFGKSGSGLEERLYAQHDANYNVTSIASTAGSVSERFIYDPYGTATTLTSTWGSTTDPYAWVYLFQGGRYDVNTGLYSFQNRDYSPTQGRWIEQDPAGYVDGMNSYEYEQSAAPEHLDPEGLDCGCFASPPPPPRWSTPAEIRSHFTTTTTAAGTCGTTLVPPTSKWCAFWCAPNPCTTTTTWQAWARKRPTTSPAFPTGIILGWKRLQDVDSGCSSVANVVP